MNIVRRAAATRVLLVAASVLAAGTALTALSVPALAANKITVTNPGSQSTNPLSAKVSLQVKATDSAKSTLSYAATGLPAGLTIGKATGLISGTITKTHSGTVKVTVTDATKAAGSTSFTWTAKNTVVVSNPGTQTTTVGNPVSVAVAAADDDKATTLAWTASGLPAGLSIAAATGIITGEPAVNGTYAVTVKVTDKTGSSASTAFTWKVRDLVAVSAPGTEQSTVSVPIVPVKVTATDSAAGQTFSYSAAGLPPGLSINAKTGVITGTPTGKTAHYAVTVTAKDATGAAGSAPISWTIGNLVTVQTPAAERSWAGIAVSVRVKATDSDPAQKLSYAASGLPAGLSIDPATGVISGTPATTGQAEVTVAAIDGTGSSGTAAVTWTVSQAITFARLGTVPLTAGVALSLPIGYSDAVPHDSVTLAVHGLPPGLAFAAPATIFGWTTKPGTYPVTVVAQSSLGDSSAMTFDLAVKPASGGGPTGQIRLDLGSRCLDDLADKAALWACQPGSAQQWTLATDGTIRAKGACLDIQGSVAYLGQGVRMWHCSGGASRETWTVGTAGELVNPASGLCLGDAGASIANGYRPTMIACRVTSSQVWLAPGAQLRSARAGKCADDLHSGGGDGNVIDMFGCNGTASQSWTVEQDFTVRMFGNRCLTDPGKLGAPGVRIALWSCASGDKGQKVIVVHRGGLGSWLTIDGVCVAIPGMTAADTAQLVTATCTPGDPRDLWDIW